MEAFKHVTGVRVLGRCVVELELVGAERRVIDLEPLLDGSAFDELLSDYGLFPKIDVDPDIATIVWPNGADLSPRTLYARSRPSVPARTAGSRGGEEIQSARTPLAWTVDDGAAGVTLLVPLAHPTAETPRSAAHRCVFAEPSTARPVPSRQVIR